MTKLSFQLPALNTEVDEHSKKNASYAMLGVVAITAIVSLVFVFQHMLVTPSFGDSTAFVISEKISSQCETPDGLLVQSKDAALVNYLREKQGYSCAHLGQEAWCCYPPKLA